MEVWKNSVSMRGGNIQQMEWWHFMVKPPLPRSKIKDCTYWRWAAGCNSEFSFPCHGKWLIPQLSLLHEISETWACNKFSAYSPPHVEGLNLISLSQRKSSLWLHRAFPPYHRRFSESMARKPTRYVSSLTWERFVRKAPARNFQLTAS